MACGGRVHRRFGRQADRRGARGHGAGWLRGGRALVDAGGTVVSVLHELSMALHADDVVVLAGGRLQHHGAASDPATHRALERVFDQRIAIHAVQGQWVALPHLTQIYN